MAEPVQQNPNLITSETSRQLNDMSYTGSATSLSSDIPKDTVIKRISMRFVGVMTVTFASGSPVASELGLSRLLSRVEVVADGNRTIKNVHPYMARMISNLTRQELPGRASLTNTANTLLPTTEVENGAWFTYPSTTQNVILEESMEIAFELPWAYSEDDRMASLFNTKGLSSAFLKATFVDNSNIQRDESSAVSVTYSAQNFKLYSSIIEAQSIPAEQPFYDHKESFSSETFSGATTRRQIKLSTGNLFCGIGMLFRNGDANKLLSDVAGTDIELRINGQRVLHQTNFLQLQQRQRARLGIKAVKSSGNHSMKGFCFLNLLNSGKISSALNTAKAAGVDSLDLFVSTAASSGTDAATYTNPVEMIYQTVELAAPPAKM